MEFNEVLEAFRKARSEKKNTGNLNTLQQVRTGILSFDGDGQVQLINANAAKKFIGVQTIKNINELKAVNGPVVCLCWKWNRQKHLGQGSEGFSIYYSGYRIADRGSDETAHDAEHPDRITATGDRGLAEPDPCPPTRDHELHHTHFLIDFHPACEILDHEMTRSGDDYHLKNEGAEDLRD